MPGTAANRCVLKVTSASRRWSVAASVRTRGKPAPHQPSGLDQIDGRHWSHFSSGRFESESARQGIGNPVSLSLSLSLSHSLSFSLPLFLSLSLSLSSSLSLSHTHTHSLSLYRKSSIWSNSEGWWTRPFKSRCTSDFNSHCTFGMFPAQIWCTYSELTLGKSNEPRDHYAASARQTGPPAPAHPLNSCMPFSTTVNVRFFLGNC